MGSSQAPPGAHAPPIPAHLWERQALGGSAGACCRRHCVLRPGLCRLGVLFRDTGSGEGTLCARAPWGPIGKTSGRARWPRAAAAVPGWPRGAGACPWWPEARCGAAAASAPQHPGPLLRLSPGGAWHVAAPRGRSFILPISQRRKLQSRMALPVCLKSLSWFRPSSDFPSEAHDPYIPGLQGSQA